jgi:hypothetical protein
MALGFYSNTYDWSMTIDGEIDRVTGNARAVEIAGDPQV